MTLIPRINLRRLFLGLFAAALVIHLFWIAHTTDAIPNPFGFDLDLLLQFGFLGALGLALLAALAAVNYKRLMSLGMLSGGYYIAAWEYLWEIMPALTLQGLFIASLVGLLTGFLIWSLDWGPIEDDVPEPADSLL